MSIIVNRRYNDNREICYTLNGEVMSSPPDLLTGLRKLGVNISADRLKFITNKHRVPRDLYEKHDFHYNDMISDIPTQYPEDITPKDPTENLENLNIHVKIYKVAGSIDHCEYIVNDHLYIRLGSLVEDLHNMGFHFNNMQQLRNAIHRGISDDIHARYPNLTVSNETITE